ncbi:TIGR04255 family protein [Nostoc sp. TCL240-02]|uniref:TIGR04255 family protein n=1 Tax=Nostoc sp. TCL240-02 TaxID=2572090 RepID=UPI00157F9125|nr:TIGR04255 family protein [Nostoc sp. TCL240-02]QKQ75564.1 TIGR04255 family protein [Nostoc sp. TCL240-02]
MQSSKHYKKSSITEALIDIRVDASSEAEIPTLKNIQQSILSQYPVDEEIIEIQGQFEGGSNITATATASQAVVGYRFISHDMKQIFQARLNGFTFSRLAPYERWENLQNEAQRLWDIYRAVIKPKNVNRVAVRYINKLDLPLPMNDFKDYLRTLPEVSPDLSQGLSDFFMQLQIPQEDIGGMLLLNEVIIPPSGDDLVSMVLDIDLFCNVNFPGDGIAHWDLLEKFRVRKNEIFEACITDKTRELLK